jgi:hypothetical protein
LVKLKLKLKLKLKVRIRGRLVRLPWLVPLILCRWPPVQGWQEQQGQPQVEALARGLL